MTTPAETMPWGALILALWPLWLCYGVLATLALSEALRGRFPGRSS